MRFLLLMLLILPVTGYGQSKMSSRYDSTDRAPEFTVLPSFVNYVNDKGRYGGVKGHEYGKVVDNQKVGLWIVEDEDDRLIAHRVYVNDTFEFEIQYRNGKIFSIVETKIGPIDTVNYTAVRPALSEKITSFNRRGKIRSQITWEKKED